MAGKKVELKFKYKYFEDLDLPTLMMKIWNYSNMHNYKDCIVPATYRNWCITVLKQRCEDTYLNFGYVVEKLCQRDEEWKFVSKRTDNNISKLYKKIEGELYF